MCCLILFPAVVSWTGAPAQAAIAQPALAQTSPIDNFAAQYTSCTKQLLLAGVELERFSLNYRLESARQPRFRRLRYFLFQEAAAAGLLTFEIIGVQQFGRGKDGLLAVSRRDLLGTLARVVKVAKTKAQDSGSNASSTGSPELFEPNALKGSDAVPLKISAPQRLKTVGGSLLTVSPKALHAAFATSLTTSIIGGAGSCLELGSNALLAISNKRHGFDPKTADNFVAAKLKRIDQLLAERDVLLQAHVDHPAYARAVVEGKILHDLRDAFVQEYATFHADARQYAALTNMYYLLNACTNALGAAGAGVAYKAVKQPNLNGPANILFIVTGGMFMASPILATLTGRLVRKCSQDSFCAKIGEKPHYSANDLTTDRSRLEALLPQDDGSLIPALPVVDRAALYAESQDRFTAQLRSETSIMRQLDKVAFQSSLFGPIIGGTLMTQGILGTRGYYQYTFNPKKQFANYYHGAVVGTTGASLAVVANAASLLAQWSYENKLRKQHRLPYQLIHDRLDHLDKVEQVVKSL